jgi:hypothetical protein
MNWETWEDASWSGGAPLPEGLQKAPGERQVSGSMYRGHSVRVFLLPRGGYRTYVLYGPYRGFVGAAGMNRADAMAKTRKMIDRAELSRDNPQPWAKVFG